MQTIMSTTAGALPLDSLTALTALSPLDGRYEKKTAPLRAWFSEFGLMKARVRVEIEWLIARSDALGLQLTGNELDNNLVGRDGADTLDGGDGNDRLRGGSGDDTLEGGDGDDRLTGGSGNDMLEGGAGRDRLRGDDGGDTFAFSNLAETGTTGATRDTILDFVQGEDLIDLSALDGVTGGADDAFAFIGDATFSGAAGELRWSEVGANTLLQGDVNGDAVVDFTVLLAGSHVLQGSDFLL